MLAFLEDLTIRFENNQTQPDMHMLQIYSLCRAGGSPFRVLWSGLGYRGDCRTRSVGIRSECFAAPTALVRRVVVRSFLGDSQVGVHGIDGRLAHIAIALMWALGVVVQQPLIQSEVC